MKISIWKQFSSNHSASFTIVAEFPTEEEAFKQYLILRRALRNIIQDFERQASDYRYDDIPPDTPPHEIESKTWMQFDVEPKFSSDWLPGLSEKWMPSVLKSLDNFILFSFDGTTWTAAEPIDRVLEQVGGKIYRIGEQYSQRFDCTVECRALNEETAIQIANALEKSQEWRDEYKEPIPWLLYFSGHRHHKVDELIRLEHEVFEYRRTLKTWKETTIRLEQRWKAESDMEKRRLYLEEYWTYRREEKPTFPDSHFEGLPFRNIYGGLYYKGDIKRDGVLIHLETDHGFAGLIDSIPAIVAWMRDMGCTVTVNFEHSTY